jgi:hypothetical protein
MDDDGERRSSGWAPRADQMNGVTEKPQSA